MRSKAIFNFSTPSKGKKRLLALLIFVLVVIIGFVGITGVYSSQTHTMPPETRTNKPVSLPKTPNTTAVNAPADTAVLTSKNDNARTGQNIHETQLTTRNVNPSQFGQRNQYPVDGQIYAQPLFLPDILINGSTHDLVFVATEHDSVYAFDADQTHTTPPLWHTSFIDPTHGITTLTPADVSGCTDIGAEIGITSTPVIDNTTNTLYVVALTKENGQFFQRLHALDVTTGQEKSGSPTTIQATVPGSGDGSVDGNVSFNPQTANQRAALLLLNSTIYITWSSFCDDGFYHGWILGYNASTLQQTAVYNDTPNGYQGGIWQSGGGLAADADNNIYVATGNGTYSMDSGGQDASDSILKLSTQQGLQVSDYFTPFNQPCLEPNDVDFGSSGVLLTPLANKVITSNKEGRIFVVDRANLGKYNTIDDVCDNQDRTDVDTITQELPPKTLVGGAYSTPSYWSGSNGTYVYMSGEADHVKAFKFDNGTLTLAAQTAETFSFPGGNTSISSNGNDIQSAILWVVEPGAVLHAYAANNLNRELYNTNQNAKRDALHSYVKFTVPTIANGQVFVGTKDSLVIYGLLKHN